MSTQQVLIDVIMLVTLNLKPFTGEISMNHYSFNPCQYTNIYKQQLVGHYNDTFEDFRHGVNRSFFTTCIDAKSGQFPPHYNESCKNIVTQVCFAFYYVLVYIEIYFISPSFWSAPEI